MSFHALYAIAALMILWRTLHVISTLDVRGFSGRPWQFIFIAAHHALVGAGAAAVALGVPAGGPMLLLGLVARLFFDRRVVR